MKTNVHRKYVLDGHRDCIYTLISGMHSNELFSASGDGMVAQWDLNNPEEGKLFAQMHNSVYALHLLSEEGMLAIGQNFEGIHLLNAHDQKEVGSVQISKSQIFDISSYDKRLFVASGDGTFYVLDLDTLSFIKKVKLSDKSIRTISINEASGEIALGLSDNSIRILDLDNYQQKAVINAHKLSVFSLSFHLPTGLLISASRDAHIKFWDIKDSYRLVDSIVAHMYAINSITIHPEQRFFATGSMDKSIKIWDVEARKLLKVIDKSRHAGHTSSVNKVLWTDHDQWLISTGDDKKICVWELGFI